ncbi:MAG: AAA family ATPase [Anaerolineales bacterium]|nr:AAA family ATPase [Anaerolineales bacterium]
MLRIQLFDTPLIESKGSSLIQFRSLKIEALFYYLAITPGQQHRRTRLASLFWSELPEDKALGNLRYALWNMRQVLDDALFSIDRGTVTFQSNDTIWVDVHEFDDLLNAAKNRAELELSEGMPRLQRAADLYQGDFLAGFELVEAPLFDDWLQVQRTTFHDKAIEVLTRLGTYYAAHHQLAKAMDATKHLLTLEPWQESAHRQMMQLLALNGRRDAALMHYQECKQILAAELGMEPEPETRLLVERIRTGQFEQASAPATTPLPETHTLATPLFGRQKEYAWLVELWKKANHKHSGLVLLEGEAGVGKTRLVEEFGRYVTLQGGRVLQGRCYEFSGPLPYQPIAVALQTQITQIETQRLSVEEDWGIELAQLLPEIRLQRGNGSSLPGGQGTDRYRLFEAVAQFLRAISAKQPILFFLDDLHWADADTLDLVGYLVQRLANTPVLMIGSYRPGEILNHHALTILQKPSSRGVFYEILKLTHISVEAVKQIVKTITPLADNNKLARFLYDISQGNPFILFETLNEMQELHWLQSNAEGRWSLQVADHCLTQEGFINADTNQNSLNSLTAGQSKPPVFLATGEPATVRDTLSEKENLKLTEVQNRIRRRISRLSAEGKQLLALAAVVGRPFETKLLQEASGLPLEIVLDSLDDWLARNLVQEVSRDEQRTRETDLLPALSHCRYDFSHDFIRAVVYNDLSQARRQALHYKLGTALEHLYAHQLGKVVEWLAHHYYCGYELDKAITYLQRAGQQARAVYALPIALERYQQALSCWEQLYRPSDSQIPTEAWRQRWDLLLGQEEVSRMLGRLQQQSPSLETMIQEVTDWGDDRDRLRVIEQQLASLEQSADLDKRRQLAQEGLRLAHTLDDPLAEANFLQAWAECDRDMANHEDALMRYEAARQKFSQMNQTRQVAFCLIGMGRIHKLNHRFAEALSHFEQAVTQAKAEGHQDALIWSYNAIARMYLILGNLNGAYALSQKSLTLCDQIGFDSGASVGWVIQGHVNMLNGNLEKAETQFQRALMINRDMGQSLRMADSLTGLGHLCLHRQEGPKALAYFRQAEELCGNFYSGRAIEARSFRAMAYLILGQPKEALNCSHHAAVWLIGRENVIYAPQRIYWNHFQVLKEWQPEEAQEALVKAHRLVRNQLDNLLGAYPTNIDNDVITEEFLTRLPWNQEIVTMWDMLPLSNSHVALHLLHGYPG